ncbi:MAG: DUF736 domain-containing protein [Inquilinus sp.]|uniref:DUF736 domain-containing protein n=1 Tax=Inquilinus sp. TaxID=1932117 RepID=UPI003F2CAB8B
MATIGNFTRSGDTIEGQVKTLEFRETVRLVPADGSSESEDAPDLIAFVADIQVGAAWKKTARESGNVYYSVRLDDPSLTGPINATLYASDADPNRFQLVWKRFIKN